MESTMYTSFKQSLTQIEENVTFNTSRRNDHDFYTSRWTYNIS